MLPLLPRNPSLQRAQRQTAHAEDNGENDPDQRRQHHISRAASALQPLLYQSTRPWILQFGVEIEQLSPKVAVLNASFFRSAHAAPVES